MGRGKGPRTPTEPKPKVHDTTFRPPREWMDVDADLPLTMPRVMPAWWSEQGSYLAELLENTSD